MSELLGKSVNAPNFLKYLEEEHGWFVSYSLTLAEKHFEDPETNDIYMAAVFIGDYLWDISKIRFEKVVHKEERTERREVSSPPDSVKDRAMEELNSAYLAASKLPPQIKERLRETEGE